jgi:hypothetical protein
MKSTHRKGLLLHPDDLEIGTVCTIHRWHDGRRFWCGDALVVKAINLPFVVAKFAAHPQRNRQDARCRFVARQQADRA